MFKRRKLFIEVIPYFVPRLVELWDYGVGIMTSRVKSLRYGNLMNLDKTWHTYWVSEFYTNIFMFFMDVLETH